MRKSLLVIFGFTLSLLAPQLPAGEPLQTPGPEQKKLEIWTGKWALKETVLATPFGQADNRDYKWDAKFAQGGFYVEGRGKGKGASGPLSWIEVHYFDPNANAFRTFYADSEGIISHGTDTVEGNTWTVSPWEMQANGKTYKARSVLTFAPDGKTYSYQWTYSEDGISWKPWLSGTAKKVGKAR